MTNNEIITELIKHDGWEIVIASESMISYYDPKSKTRGGAYKRYCFISIDAQLEEHWLLRPYLADIGVLHRMSLVIIGQLKSLYSEEDTAFDFEHDMKVTDVKGNIVAAMFKDKNESGEYLDLATSLAEAIQFINQHKANG